MKSLRNIVAVAGIFICLLNVRETQAQAEQPSAIAGPKGNWVVCGSALPKSFGYKIWRKRNGSDWISVATLHMPATVQELKAAAYSIQQQSELKVAQFDDSRIQSLWKRIKDPVMQNSPAEITNDLLMRAASGTAWYDATAVAKESYTYRVQLTTNEGESVNKETNSVSFPGAKFTTTITPIEIKPLVSGLTGEFKVADKGVMVYCKVMRSYYLRTGFEEIAAEPMFVGREGQTFIQFSDRTAAPKVPYTYIIVPLDKAGNEGYASPEAKVFNVADKTIAPSVYQFQAYSDEARHAIRLGWRLDDPRDIISIDVYKSATYDGLYQKIGSVGPRDTTFTDISVDPISNCYYTVRLNGRYEVSPPSPRIPGILKASEPNPLPIVNAELKQNGNQVTISWQRSKRHTHAYFVYRDDGDGNSKQIGPPIITDSLNVSFTDNLPETADARTYVYRVADENTSYVISPPSPPMYAYTGGLSSLPIPYQVNIRAVNNRSVMIFWADLRQRFNNFGGYRLYRRVQGGKPEQVGNAMLTPGVNVFTDTTTLKAGTYYYSLRTIGEDGQTLSSPSLEAGYTVAANMLAGVNNVKAIPAEKAVQLTWDNPMGYPVTGIQIMRAVEGKAPQLLTTLPANAKQFDDAQVTPGNVYYYSIVAVYSSTDTVSTDPMGVRAQ